MADSAQKGLTFVMTVAVMAVAIWTLADFMAAKRTGGSANPESPTLPDTLELSGAAIKGPSSAKAVLVQYSDFQCSFCGQFARESLPVLVSRYVDAGVLQIAFRHLPDGSRHPEAEAMAVRAICADRQGRFWDSHDLFFGVRGELVKRAADAGEMSALGLDPEEFSACMDGNGKKSLDEDRRSAGRLNIRVTPMFYVGTRDADGIVRAASAIPGAQPIEIFVRAIEAALRR